MYHSLETRIWFLIIFLPLKESLTLFQTWVFCWPSIILFHLELSRIDLPKLTSSILMEIVTILVALVDEFCFYMHHPIKVWLFEKIFELVYLFHIALKSLLSILRQVKALKKMVVLSVNFTILILWSPVSFNPFISINEIGKYHSHNIV